MKSPSSGKIDTAYRQWEALHKTCGDSNSQSRLEQLSGEMAQWPKSQAVSALAEIETAFFLVNAGFSISFLDFSHGRTADLECYDGSHRFFAEITVIQSTQGAKRNSTNRIDRESQNGIDGDDFFEQALVRRLLARMAEKAKQLEAYCAPVLLAVSVPDLFDGCVRTQEISPLDLQRLAGLLIGVLSDVPQFSAVLLTLWNAPAQASRNAIRIHQVSWVTRPSGNGIHPRIRLLAKNPFAWYRLTTTELQMIETVM